MSHERWQRVNELFQAALDRDVPERPAFLDQACAGDEALRGEVDSLLASHQSAGSFLDGPASQLALSDATTEDAEPQAERLAPGSRLGPYEVVALLGAGGMGEVYRARDPRLDRDVAIKILSGGAPDQGPRLTREARAAGALNHPNVLAVYDVGEESGTPYVVCELLEGETLRDRLRRGAVPWRESLELAGQVLAGMGAAHERGIVHRDLKPENLFLTRDGRVKILDFGLAKQSPLHAAGAHGAATTQAGMIRGTIGYMSPEQLKSLPADHRSDIFAFGAILYELVAGRRAFAGGSPVETMSAILTEAPDLAGLSGAPPALAAVVERCLHRDPAERYGSARDVAAALEACAAAGLRQAPAREAIAVLPFLNVGADPEQEYFCEGLAAELIHTLARLEGLRVASRTSAFRFKGRGENVQQIGKELGVGRVLEGSVRRAGDRLRITVQLIDVASGYHVWSERYDRSVADVFAVQDEIAAQVVEALRLQLDPRQARMRRYTQDVEAYHLYLKGVHFWNKRHEGGLQQAVGAFAQAIERDPLYAPAHAGLAQSYAILGLSVYDVQPAREAMPRARAAALKALEIDPGLAAAHTALGWIRLHYDWDWAAAEAAFQRALELDPDRATSHHWYGFYLSAMGRAEEALAESRRAFELEPLSLIINSQLCQPLYYARRFEEVGGAARKVLEMEPSFAIGHFWLGHAHAAARRYAEAIAEYEAFALHGGGSSLARALVGNALARAGDRKGAVEVLEELRAVDARRPVPAFHFVLVHAGLGDVDPAFAALQTALEERSDQLAFLGVEPLLDPLRRDPRFEVLIERLALPVSARRAAPGPALAETPRRSVAVLPFRDLEGQGEDAHLGLGLADATITELARSRSLVVRPTSAILRYQDRQADPQRAGRELGVDAVVDGRFQRAGSRLRVTVQVMDTNDGRSLWAGKIDCSLEDIFQVQDDVSRGIALALDVELTPAGEGRVVGRPQAPVAAAYELYLEGKLHLFRETLDDMVAAVDCFEKARAADPGFALACAGLADAYSRIGFTYQPEGDWFRRAQSMCDKALELDPDLPEGRYVRARLRWSPQGGFDHAAAIRDLLTAIQGRPSLEEAYMRLGVVIHHVGLIDEARRLFDRALLISPEHVVAQEHQGMCLLHQGRYEEALAVSLTAARRAPMAWIHYQVALCQLRLGRLEAARETAASMCAQVPGEILSYPILGLAAALEGDAAAALEQVEKSARHKKSYGHYHHAQYDAACIHALLGRTDDALAWLTDAARNGYPCVTFFERDELLTSLRGEERFVRLMRELREEREGYARLYSRVGEGTAPP